jgi:phage terminase small subunit
MKGRKPRPSSLRLVPGDPQQAPAKPRRAAVAARAAGTAGRARAEAKTEWRRVARLLHGAESLSTIDRAALAAYRQVWARRRHAERALVEMAARDPLDLLAYLGPDRIVSGCVGGRQRAMRRRRHRSTSRCAASGRVGPPSTACPTGLPTRRGVRSLITPREAADGSPAASRSSRAARGLARWPRGGAR